VRLDLSGALLAGARTTYELAQSRAWVLPASSAIICELQAAGLVVQRRRSDYAMPAGQVIPCLVLEAAAQECAHVREFAS